MHCGIPDWTLTNDLSLRRPIIYFLIALYNIYNIYVNYSAHKLHNFLNIIRVFYKKVSFYKIHKIIHQSGCQSGCQTKSQPLDVKSEGLLGYRKCVQVLTNRSISISQNITKLSASKIILVRNCNEPGQYPQLYLVYKNNLS